LIFDLLFLTPFLFAFEGDKTLVLVGNSRSISKKSLLFLQQTKFSDTMIQPYKIAILVFVLLAIYTVSVQSADASNSTSIEAGKNVTIAEKITSDCRLSVRC
jgi:hypothetical protein